MKYTNANSFKAKIKNISKEKGIPAQQVQQNYLIEQVLRLIVKSKYQENFIVKGGHLIGTIIGVDKRTTMDLDVTIKNEALSEENLVSIFNEILSRSEQEGFSFQLDSLAPIRKDDDYGGFQIKINATYQTLKEVVFIDVTTGDKITPREIEYSIKSIFYGDEINILSYNLETVLAEKLESVISRGEASTRPRDRYDLFTIWNLRQDEIQVNLLKTALNNTAAKRGSLEEIAHWEEQLNLILTSEYQKHLWTNYQRSFKYAGDISFEDSANIVKTILEVVL